MIQYRQLYEKLEKHLASKSFTILTGARQTGKTSLLKKLYSKLKSDGEIAVLVNLENKEVLKKLDNRVTAIFDFVGVIPTKIIDGKSDKRIYLLIDEVQYLEDPSNFLKHIYDEYEYNVKIIATGSSAFYIDTKFRDSLAGRKRIFKLHPLSFNEFLIFKRQEVVEQEIVTMAREPSYVSQYQVSIEGLLREYMTYGGYPAIVLEDNIEEKMWLLDELKNSYLRRDIVESGVDKEHKFMMLIKILADQVGNLVNSNELSNTIGLDNKTVDRYLYILEKSFHINLIKPYHTNIRKELTKRPKVFFNDLGLRNAILGRFSFLNERMDKGALLENFVHNQLRIKYSNLELKYWRTIDGKEVDFIIEERFNEGYAIEVKWDQKQFRPNKYKKFMELYPDFPLSCIDYRNTDILSY